MRRRLVFSGSYGETSGASAESAAMAKNTTRPTIARGWCRKRSSASAQWLRSRRAGAAALSEPDTGVEISIEHVCHQVREDDERRRDDEYPHEDRVVEPRGGVPEEPAHARPAIDLLGDERAAEELGQVERRDGDE